MSAALRTHAEDIHYPLQTVKLVRRRRDERRLPTGEQERDEAGFFGHVQLEARAAEDVFYHGF